MSKDKRRTALECAGAEILSRLGWTLTDEDGAEVTASDVADIIEAASEGDTCEWSACDIADPAAFVTAADAIHTTLRCRIEELDLGNTITIQPDSILHDGFKRLVADYDAARRKK